MRNFISGEVDDEGSESEGFGSEGSESEGATDEGPASEGSVDEYDDSTDEVTESHLDIEEPSAEDLAFIDDGPESPTPSTNEEKDEDPVVGYLTGDGFKPKPGYEHRVLKSGERFKVYLSQTRARVTRKRRRVDSSPASSLSPARGGHIIKSGSAVSEHQSSHVAASSSRQPRPPPQHTARAAPIDLTGDSDGSGACSLPRLEHPDRQLQLDLPSWLLPSVCLIV